MYVNNVNGFISKHATFTSSEFCIDTVRVPEKLVTVSKAIQPTVTKDFMRVAAKQILSDPAIPMGQILVEYEIAMWEYNEYVAVKRTIPEHT